jgi:hypothetical protein
MEKNLDVLDLTGDLRNLVAECEISGRRALFRRGERSVALLVSWDEYLALRETVSILGDAALRERLESAERAAAGGALLQAEDLFVE